ncbi:MAG: BamA/TamA family outer membrane protein [Bacteroidaceae bacterium]|nr:BamA/TamA family outer membrane protein [Bacteroidaceae bacterium]
MTKIKNILLLLVALLVSACSVTKNLPEGELLYIGQKPMLIQGNDSLGDVGTLALEEVTAALATAPNNALLGSSSVRIPFPIGLWIYNAYAKSEKGLGKWIFNHFAADPVFMSTVNPGIRTQAAKNILRDYGYFRGSVSYEVIPHKTDSLQARLQYKVNMDQPYFIDTVYYKGFTPRTMSIFERARSHSSLLSGTQFNINDLNAERTRLSNLLRNVGDFYFRPDYITYQADTTRVPGGGHVSLRVVPVEGLPTAAQKPFVVGSTTVNFVGAKGEAPNDSTTYRGVKINYYDKVPVRPNMLYRWLDYNNYRMKRRMDDSTGISSSAPRTRYSLQRQTRIQERLANLGIFRYQEMQYVPRDSALVNDTLDVIMNMMMDKPYSVTADFNVKLKSNNQMGPGASFGITRNNVFGAGESLSLSLTGSYEWQTGKHSSSDMNSYELGINADLTFPRVVFPRIGDREYDFPATTTFSLYAKQLVHPKYYHMRAFGGSATYEFQPTSKYKHSLTPLKLTYNTTSDHTNEFWEIYFKNPGLYASLENQFIPQMSYTLTFDDSKVSGIRHTKWWQITFASAGNVTSAIYKLAGKDWGESGKKFLGSPFAQFLKLNTEFRYHYVLNDDMTLAMRATGGFIWAYGNSTYAPFTELFYVGGANSVRAWPARRIGPGANKLDEDNRLFFMHMGDMRLEANIEFRFRLFADLHGAIFLDAGNVWNLRNRENAEDQQFRFKNLLKQTALGTGLGLRYDLDFLVFRLDLGLGLHAPYETGKSGYFNLPKWNDAMTLHFAIGYPF